MIMLIALAGGSFSLMYMQMALELFRCLMILIALGMVLITLGIVHYLISILITLGIFHYLIIMLITLGVVYCLRDLSLPSVG
jgi:hypothetical protein